MPNKFYSLPKSVFEHYHAKIKDWVKSILPTKTSDLDNDSDFIDQLALAGIVASNFSTSSTYEIGDYVLYNHTLYRCTTAISSAGDWDSSKWTVTKTQDIFQGSAPGLVPAAESGDADKVLKGDGTWGVVSGGSTARVSYDAQTEELSLDFSPPPIIDPDIVLLQDWMTYDIGAQLSSGTIPTVEFDADGPLDVTGTGWSGTPYINQASLGKVKITDWTENTSENLKYNLENLLDLSHDWTFECWIKQSNTGYEDSYNVPSYMTLHKTSGNMSIFGSFKNAISCIGRNMEYEGIRSDTTNWHHICVIRYSGTNKLYVDGTLRATNTSVTFSNDLLHFIIVPRLWVQYSASNYDYRYLTRIAQVCLTKRAKWTDNFTPPTKPYCLGTPRNKATT